MVSTKCRGEIEQVEARKPCEVVAIEKRRDGGTRYWCRSHRADATAKYGMPAPECRLADSLSVRDEDIQVLDLDKYAGGVALWGAAPAVYDTTRLPVERGIHVHARPTPKSDKEIDFTYQSVRIVGKRAPAGGIIVNQTDALYYLVSTVLGCATTFIACTYCRSPHLDMDYFSVHPHRRHRCANCGRNFSDRGKGIGNPIAAIREACGADIRRIVPSPQPLNIKQSDYPGGIQVWGSNPAFLWTQCKEEQEGIHVHAFVTEDITEPTIDETFGEVVIDGVRLDPTMVRVLMAQNVLPLLKGRVRSAHCPNCAHSHFDEGEAAYSPSRTHKCKRCGAAFAARGRIRNTVVNPLPAIIENLAKLAPREPQRHEPDQPFSAHRWRA